MAQRTVLVTGAGGLIGSHLLKTAPAFAPGWNVVGLTRHHLDLTNGPAVRRTLEWYKPHLIIHCAALSKSTACQQNPALAKKINVEVTDRLTIEIQDDGVGINLEKLRKFGNGLNNMKKRMASIEGEFKIENHKGTRTTFHLHL